jgi:hypothetical protein
MMKYIHLYLELRPQVLNYQGRQIEPRIYSITLNVSHD